MLEEEIRAKAIEFAKRNRILIAKELTNVIKYIPAKYPISVLPAPGVPAIITVIGSFSGIFLITLVSSFAIRILFLLANSIALALISSSNKIKKIYKHYLKI